MSNEPEDDFTHITIEDLVRKHPQSKKKKKDPKNIPVFSQTSASFPFMPASMAVKEAARGAQRTMEENQRKQEQERLEKARLIEERIAVVYPNIRKDAAEAIAKRCTEGFRVVDIPLRHDHGEHLAHKLGMELVELGYVVSSPFMKNVADRDEGYRDIVWHIKVSW